MRARDWKKRNPENTREHHRKARSTPEGKLNCSMEHGIYYSLKNNKKGHWENFTDYDVHKLKKHLEKQFLEGMSWDNYNYRGWHIDHIIPISAFNFKTPNDIDFKRCWALKNLRPLWAKDNLKKSNKLIQNFQPSLAF